VLKPYENVESPKNSESKQHRAVENYKEPLNNSPEEPQKKPVNLAGLAGLAGTERYLIGCKNLQH